MTDFCAASSDSGIVTQQSDFLKARLSWVAVAFHMGGSEDSVRKTHDRFLRSDQ
ncbi:MAG: hypothetical protein RSD08_08995 [Oscillospiraceae bacterium]